MGGGSYYRDVPTTPVNMNEVFRNTGSLSREAQERGERAVASILDIKGKVRECCDSAEKPDTTPIVIALDVTRSRGKDAHVIFEKLPRFMGVANNSGIVTFPQVLFAAIGDARQRDSAPLQVSQFEADQRLDEALSKIRIEEGGGGNGKESYELAAFYLARRAKIDAWEKRQKKGWFFFLGDEQPYDEVSAQDVLRIMGVEIKTDIPTPQIFRELQERFNVFFIYPASSWKDRQADIDAEIRKRLVQAGGRFKDVSIRVSLLWDNYNDLDLHVICPSGEEIYYVNKQSRCGGELDVDRNAGGAQTNKPVENIRWPKGEAPAGHYKVFVQHFATHDSVERSPFRVELDIDGEIQHFTGVTHEKGRSSRGDYGRENVQVIEFNYDPSRGRVQTPDKYADYKDEAVLAKWGSLIPPEHILRIQDARACVDTMIGVMTLATGKQTLDEYIKNLGTAEKDGGVGQTAARCKDVREALQALAQTGVKKEVGSIFGPGKSSRRSSSRRIK
jgi:subtilisin-like proprotein convertase family protein